MFYYFQRYAKYILLLLFVSLFICMWKYPSLAPAFGIAFLLFNLVLGISSIFEKYKQVESPRPKIVKAVLILIFTFFLIIFLGRLAGMYANHYTSPRFGFLVGFISAVVASFMVGYLVKMGISYAIRDVTD